MQIVVGKQNSLQGSQKTQVQILMLLLSRWLSGATLPTKNRMSHVCDFLFSKSHIKKIRERWAKFILIIFCLIHDIYNVIISTYNQHTIINDALFFLLKVWNPEWILYFLYILIQTSHDSRARQPCVASSWAVLVQTRVSQHFWVFRHHLLRSL